jgi:hypothetical protein
MPCVVAFEIEGHAHAISPFTEAMNGHGDKQRLMHRLQTFGH